MQIPQLQIETTRGILGLQIDKPVQEIEQPKAELIQQQPAAILEISTTDPKLSIDTTENRADIDMKSIIRRMDENVQFGKQSVLEGMARRAEEGQQLMRIENGGNAIVDISKQIATPPPAPLGIRFVGNRLKLKMSIEPGTTDIQWKIQQPVNNVKLNKPIHNYTPGKVTGRMEQYPSIQIDWKI